MGGTTTVSAAGFDVTLDQSGNNFTGAVGVTGANVVLVDASGIVLGTSAVSGTYAVTATAGDITNTGALVITGASTFTANGAGASITLANAANNFTGTVTFAGSGGLANVTVADISALDLQALSLTSNLSVTVGGAVTQSGALAVTGTTTLAATVAGTDIDLSTQANVLTGAVSIGGTAANVRDFKLKNTSATAGAIGNLVSTSLRDLTVIYTAAGYQIPTLTMGSLRNIVVTTTGGGAITQAAGGIVQGVTGATATFTAGANAITLTSGANDFLGVVTLSNSGVNDVAVTDANSITLGTVAIGGDLDVDTASGIATTGSIVSSTSGYLFLYSDAGDLTLGEGTTYSGQNITMSTGGNLVNNTANSSPFTNQNGGRTLIFSTSPNDNQPSSANGGFSGFGAVYSKTLADIASLPAGNQMVYSDPLPVSQLDSVTLNQIVETDAYLAAVPLTGASLPALPRSDVRLGFRAGGPQQRAPVVAPLGQVDKNVGTKGQSAEVVAPGRLKVSQMKRVDENKAVGQVEGRQPMVQPVIRIGVVSLRSSGEYLPFELAEVTMGGIRISQK